MGDLARSDETIGNSMIRSEIGLPFVLVSSEENFGACTVSENILDDLSMLPLLEPVRVAANAMGY